MKAFLSSLLDLNSIAFAKVDITPTRCVACFFEKNEREKKKLMRIIILIMILLHYNKTNNENYIMRGDYQP